ncbi:uncharacterized protein M6B38_374975 [Iris pallida]|uniref:Uncharacterized protein n=1 Tax=Iris pallida TaxID=29817 RepID=A0AAX6GCH7_IRIPA|nr:uncharacterized protein M6B38_374970 [Iris pallida]KAJ6825949.1 uncharacterized protein M6B38_374975 [Iris pallida]
MKAPDLRSCSSPSQSDIPSRTVRCILCGSRTIHSKRRSSDSRKQKYIEKSFQGVPLLANSYDSLILQPMQHQISSQLHLKRLTWRL